MLKRCMLCMLLALVLVVGFCSASFAETMPPIPAITLTVTQQSMSPIEPPIVTYTAQLSYVPVNGLVIDFYNTSANDTTTKYVLIGSAAVDNSGKAVLNKQMAAGTYAAYSQTVIFGSIDKSNTVIYTVK